MTRLGFPLPQVATGDLDISIVGQLLATNLPLGDEFEPGPVQVIGFEAPFWRGPAYRFFGSIGCRSARTQQSPTVAYGFELFDASLRSRLGPVAGAIDGHQHHPGPAVDARRLVRAAHLDLTGLPISDERSA